MPRANSTGPFPSMPESIMVKEQNEPMLDGATDAGREAKIDGLVAQISADAVGRDRAQIRALVAQRFTDAGMDFDDATLDDVAERVAERQN
jgi:hypothetical protein